jgi:hypothetical protein
MIHKGIVTAWLSGGPRHGGAVPLSEQALVDRMPAYLELALSVSKNNLQLYVFAEVDSVSGEALYVYSDLLTNEEVSEGRARLAIGLCYDYGIFTREQVYEDVKHLGKHLSPDGNCATASATHKVQTRVRLPEPWRWRVTIGAGLYGHQVRIAPALRDSGCYLLKHEAIEDEQGGRKG